MRFFNLQQEFNIINCEFCFRISRLKKSSGLKIVYQTHREVIHRDQTRNLSLVGEIFSPLGCKSSSRISKLLEKVSKIYLKKNYIKKHVFFSKHDHPVVLCCDRIFTSPFVSFKETTFMDA